MLNENECKIFEETNLTHGYGYAACVLKYPNRTELMKCTQRESLRFKKVKKKEKKI
jgi:hypothetical protein